ncbi:polyprotein [Sanghuangporus baumii]|uniref:Polyprotein n=1 Tax=Sanghuangporus baumii TaxID=108892 RepID=A0A9Q5I5F5_SANBA|nr:polyprotein [Sanghuangporus baumii]
MFNLSSAQSMVTSEELGLMRDAPYHEMVGSLMYAALATRPDIAFAVTLLSKFSINPGLSHFNALRCIFAYLKGTINLQLTYGGVDNIEFKGFTDADGSMQEDHRAISGNAFLINGGMVSWYLKTQEIVSLSTIESEYIAAVHTAKEAIWLKQLISQIFSTINKPIILYADNKGAIDLAKTRQFSARTKHMDIQYHFLCWVCKNGTIKLVYCPTEDMTADILTKPLPSFKVKHFANELGLRMI